MIARDGWTLILIGLVLTVVALWLATRWDNRIAFVFSMVLALATVFTVYFFRDPDRSVILEPDMLVAPADGRVVEIDTLESHPFVGSPVIQVSIFLSVFDVHVNRIPATGAIDYVNYNSGKFLAAFEDKASEENEQTEIGMTSTSGQRLVFKQIAGIIARRIVCRLDSGDRVTAGSRFGLIRFGSRVDLLLPESSHLRVKVGDHVRGGESVIGYLGQAKPASSPVESEKGTDAGL